MLRFHRTPAFGQPAGTAEDSPERMIYHTDAWLRFLAASQGATPVRATLVDEAGRARGHVCGLVVSVLGAKIFGSPLPGWTTMYMGFVLEPGVPREEALAALAPFAFGELGCVHLEVVDRHLGGAAPSQEHVESYETDLTKSEDELFGAMESACRRCIRKAEKSGLVIEEVGPGDPTFADEYHSQLIEVFAKQRLVPTYGVDRVRALVSCLEGTGRLLLLRARNPEGACIATGIYPGMNRVAQFWGNASVRAQQLLRPNEALNWYAMRWWKARGAEVFDWGGGGTYKEKYGCAPIAVPRVRASKYALLARARDALKAAHAGRQRLLGLLGAAWGRA